MNYKIIYLNSQNEKIIEYGEFESKDDVLSSNKYKSYSIIGIDEIKNLKSFKKIKQKQLNLLLKQFSILLSSGLDVEYAITVLCNMEKNQENKNILKSVLHNLMDGNTLSDSFKMTNRFPGLLIGVIEAGETSSTLPKSLEILSNYYEIEEKTKQNLKNALYYPGILLFVTFFVVFLMLTFVLPNFVTLFSSYDNLDLPLMTKTLIKVSEIFKSYCFITIILLLLVLLLIKGITKESHVIKLHGILLKIPILGNYILNYELQRFSGIFALLLSSGIETLEGINVSANTIKNKYLKYQIFNYSKEIIKGSTIYQAMSKINELPEMFLNLINVGEVSSNLVETMNISHKYYKDIVEQESKKLTSIFEPIIIIIVSLLVGSIVIAIAMPMFELVNII